MLQPVIIMRRHMSSSPHLRALWGAALCCALPLATRAADGPCVEPWETCRRAAACRREPAPRPAATRPLGNGRRGPGGDITYRSDRFDFSSDGLMELQRQCRRAHGRSRRSRPIDLTYDRNNNNLTAAGAVRYRDPIVLLQGDTGHYNDQSADFSHGTVPTAQAARPRHGRPDVDDPGQGHHAAST